MSGLGLQNSSSGGVVALKSSTRGGKDLVVRNENSPNVGAMVLLSPTPTWRGEHRAAPLSNLSLMWRQNVLCDVVLVCDSDSTTQNDLLESTVQSTRGQIPTAEKFPAHRAVLAAASERFLTMFSSWNGHGGLSQEIVVEGVSNPAALRQMLPFLYTGEYDMALATLVPLCSAAIQYKIQPLIDIVVAAAMDAVSAGTCCMLLEQAQLFDLSDLEAACRERLLRDFPAVIVAPPPVAGISGFLDLSAFNLKWLMERDELYVPTEDMLYRAAMNWVRRRPEAREEHIDELLSRVRFPLMNMEELAKCDDDKTANSTLLLRNLVYEAFKYRVDPAGFHGVRFRPRTGRPWPSATPGNTRPTSLASPQRSTLSINA
eukprot:gnl/Spiro4/28206_TR13954_c0_g1_i1.p1 gnl/Spiro4/28206_TR13954_c0_g1~~gnl/Spiro4/28206_TR13954_c0_g1_i1.p1  ORF type:complete len:408 (+),score=99.25 gnl/Spiro4/28206_TR13954_c0_g1_i1:106-1224(+)